MTHGKQTEKQESSILTTIKAVSISASCEVILWHPIDTAKLRWMALKGNDARIKYPSEFPNNAAFKEYYGRIIFHEAYNLSAASKYLSLTNGMTTALFYRVYQRLIVNTMGLYGAPKMTEASLAALPEHYRTAWAKGGLTVTFSAMTGLLEAALVHPVDTIKNQKQVAKAGSAWQIVKSDGFGLWKAWEAAAVRNMLGASIHWSTFAALKSFLLRDDPDRKLTPLEATLVSTASVSASIIGTNPLNLAKLRVQTAKKLGHADTTVKAELVDVLLKRTFMHGVIPNLVSSVPRKSSALALTVILMNWLEELAPDRDPAVLDVTEKESVESVLVHEATEEPVSDDPLFDPWNGYSGRYSFFHPDRTAKLSRRVIEHDETPGPGL